MSSWSFTEIAFTAAAMVAVILSYLGVYVVLRKITFVGVTLAQLATAGIALSELVSLPCTAGAGIVMLLGVGCFAQKPSKRSLPSEGLVGAAYAIAGAAAILLTSFAPHSDADILSLLFGNILGTSPDDIYQMAAIFSVIGLLALLFSKQLKLVSFDPDMAQSIGYNVVMWNYAFFLAVGLAIAAAIHAAGILLVFSLLVLPPLTGLALNRHWNSVCLISLVTAVTSVAVGVWSSVYWDLPTAAAISACAGAFFILASIVKRMRKYAALIWP